MIPGVGAAMGAAQGIIGGLTGIAGGLIGGGKRRREQREAQAEFNRNKARYENLDTSNLASNLDNAYEDLTVNTQAADFAAQQQQQALSNTMGSMQGAAGGGGIAALAQAMAGQSNQQAQQASVSIGEQEQANQSRTMNQAASIQNQQIEGEYQKREHELGKIDTMMQLTGQELQAAQAAKSQSDQMLISGIGEAAGMATPNMAQFLKGKPK